MITEDDEELTRLTWPVNQVDGPTEPAPMEQMDVEEPGTTFQREYLQGPKLNVALACLIVATFLLMLDTSVIATAVSTLHSSVLLFLLRD